MIDIHKRNIIGISNLQLMKMGHAPIGPDGKTINLHHLIQTNDSAIAEVTQTMHQHYTKILHINLRNTPSGIDRVEFERWRRAYWKNRAKCFELGY